MHLNGVTNSVLAATLLVVSFSVFGATITVTTTSDVAIMGDGCSLREAIMSANSDTATNECPAGLNVDEIHFNIPGGGIQEITLLTELPTITTPVLIDGRTQPETTCPFEPKISITADVDLVETVFRFEAGSDQSGVLGVRIHSMNQPAFNTAYGTAFRVQDIDGFQLACNIIGLDLNNSGDGRMARTIAAESVSNLVIGGREGSWDDNPLSNLFHSVLGLSVRLSSEVDIAGNWIGAAPVHITNQILGGRGISVNFSTRVHIGVLPGDSSGRGGNVLSTGAIQAEMVEDMTIFGNRMGVYPNGQQLPGAASFVLQIAELSGTSEIGRWNPTGDPDHLLANVILDGGGCLGSIYGWAGCTIDIRATQLNRISVAGNLFLGPEQPHHDYLSQGIHAAEDTENVTLANNAFTRWPGAFTLADSLGPISFAPDSGSNCIEGNELAVWNPYDLVASLPNNWWGSPDGPSGAGTGNGDPIDSGVAYEPFLTQRPASCSLLRLAPRNVVAIPTLLLPGKALLILLFTLIALYSISHRHRAGFSGFR